MTSSWSKTIWLKDKNYLAILLLYFAAFGCSYYLRIQPKIKTPLLFQCPAILWMGFKSQAAHYYWLLLQGDDTLTAYERYRYANFITDLDPYLIIAYRFNALFLAYYQNRSDLADQIMQKWYYVLKEKANKRMLKKRIE